MTSRPRSPACSTARPPSPSEREYALVLPDLAKMTSYTRQAIMSAVIEAGAVKW